MIFNVLNFILTAFLIGETIYVDRVESKNPDATNPAISNVLLLAITVAMFSMFSCLNGLVTPSLFTLLMRVCFVIEGCMLVNIAFCFPYYAWNYTSGVAYIVKFLLYIVVCFFVFIKFKVIKISEYTGLSIESAYLFSGDARKIFNWTWADLYNAIFRHILPLGGVLAMLIKNEAKATKLDRHKGYVYTIALLSMWVMMLSLNVISRVSPGFSLLHYFIYVPILIILPYASWLKQAPSGRSIISFFFKSIFYYLVPSALAGVAYMWIFHLGHDYGISLAVVGVFVVLVVAFVGRLVIKPLLKIGRRFIHSSDYAQAFEKDLASIDYSGDMDTIANDMFQIFNKNAEASSLSVFINGGNNTYECAYSSTAKKTKIEDTDGLFESLLNVGKNVVIYNELDSLHSLSGVKKSLSKFFKNTSSDALFILNEGRDVHGLILLGAKAGNDHYKDYDLNVFLKLYSYFFVFGYYMRNISNKEIIGTVNRELKMSSQIITSIQENMDLVKHPKMDAGCIMVPAHNIGGEFVDMIRLTDNRHLFVVGDLSGKGIAASMSMVILKAIIRAYLAETHDFKQLVVKVNQFIRYNLQKGTIFAGMFAIVNFENDTMYYINCGIPAIFLYTEAYNNVIEIQGSGHILGFVKDISPYISVKQIKLRKNDIVLTCTDGLIESHSLRGEQFGKDRIQRNMVANAMYPASRMARFSYDELVRFMSHEMEDDVSILVLKYLKDNESDEKEAAAASGKSIESQGSENEASDEVSDEISEGASGVEANGDDAGAGAGDFASAENGSSESDSASEGAASGDMFVSEDSIVEESLPDFSDSEESSVSTEVSSSVDEPEAEPAKEKPVVGNDVPAGLSDDDFDVDSLLEGIDIPDADF